MEEVVHLQRRLQPRPQLLLDLPSPYARPMATTMSAKRRMGTSRASLIVGFFTQQQEEGRPSRGTKGGDPAGGTPRSGSGSRARGKPVALMVEWGKRWLQEGEGRWLEQLVVEEVAGEVGRRRSPRIWGAPAVAGWIGRSRGRRRRSRWGVGNRTMGATMGLGSP